MKKIQKKAKKRRDVDFAPDDGLEAYRITIRDRLDSMIRQSLDKINRLRNGKN